MKDRLQELKQAAKEQELCKQNTPVHSKTPQNEENFPQHAIIFEKEPVIDGFLQDGQRLQEDIDNLADDVQRFGQQQKSLLSSMRRFSAIKIDSTKDVKTKAENIKRRLDNLAKEAKKSEAESGSSSAVTRILKTHHAVLFNQFQNVMLRYNKLITEKQEKCKTFIVRQLEVCGKDVSEEAVEDMLEKGKWNIFSENILTDVKITKAQLSEIEQRHKELINLETKMRDLKDLFLQISILVEEQGEMINNIETTVTNTENYVQKTKEQFKSAAKYRRRNPCRVLCCWCCPCY
ncbi:syntaxin-19 [Protopterus annectens]|uniref:syntaxin-19 n=1 Tax=Protopterus annectens TaxID=7888 RepID=UPI001CF9D33B|nr:syntaxin-19 [Protopterus annectens]XP_043928094.1 syntaxin-19 [Protopterus annectens]